jgi:hypothetical protein
MSAALGAAGAVLLYAILRFLTLETSDFTLCWKALVH